MTQPEETTALAAPEPEETEQKTTLIIEKLDRTAVGSRKIIREWQRLFHEFNQARYELGIAEDAYKMARFDYATNPKSEGAKAQVVKDHGLFLAAEKYFLDCQDALEAHYLNRFSTSDGSPVQDAIDQLSLEQWQLITDSDLEAINVPKKKS